MNTKEFALLPLSKLDEFATHEAFLKFMKIQCPKEDKIIEIPDINVRLEDRFLFVLCECGEVHFI